MSNLDKKKVIVDVGGNNFYDGLPAFCVMLKWEILMERIWKGGLKFGGLGKKV